MNNYSLSDICCAFVTYNGDEESIKHIKEMSNIVGSVVVIDNCSNESFLRQLSGVGKQVLIIHNDKNYGIAHALNQGLSIAIEKKKPLLLTMDQDSEISEYAITQLIESINLEEGVVSVGPTFGRTSIELNAVVKYLITSGNLVLTEALSEIGGYDSSLFIDDVDIDVSFALRKKGYKLLQVASSRMNHKIGEFEYSRFLKIKHLTHSPTRFYYMYRNTIIVAKKYWSVMPIDCSKLLIALAMIDTPQLLFIENNKKNKIKNAIRGIIEGVKEKR